MPGEVAQYGPLAGAFASGCAAAWAFANKIIVPARLKALEVEVGLLNSEVERLNKEVTKLQEKADKYDALGERLLNAQFAKTE